MISSITKVARPLLLLIFCAVVGSYLTNHFEDKAYPGNQKDVASTGAGKRTIKISTTDGHEEYVPVNETTENIFHVIDLNTAEKF